MYRIRFGVKMFLWHISKATATVPVFILTQQHNITGQTCETWSCLCLCRGYLLLLLNTVYPVHSTCIFALLCSFIHLSLLWSSPLSLLWHYGDLRCYCLPKVLKLISEMTIIPTISSWSPNSPQRSPKCTPLCSRFFSQIFICFDPKFIKLFFCGVI